MRTNCIPAFAPPPSGRQSAKNLKSCRLLIHGMRRLNKGLIHPCSLSASFPFSPPCVFSLQHSLLQALSLNSIDNIVHIGWEQGVSLIPFRKHHLGAFFLFPTPPLPSIFKSISIHRFESQPEQMNAGIAVNVDPECGRNRTYVQLTTSISAKKVTISTLESSVNLIIKLDSKMQFRCKETKRRVQFLCMLHPTDHSFPISHVTCEISGLWMASYFWLSEFITMPKARWHLKICFLAMRTGLPSCWGLLQSSVAQMLKGRNHTFSVACLCLFAAPGLLFLISSCQMQNWHS